MSDGTFGRVIEVEELATGKSLAIKIIKAVDKYINSAKVFILI